MARFWVIVDEDGKSVENVSYMHHPTGDTAKRRKNASSLLTNKFYQLLERRTRRERAS